MSRTHLFFTDVHCRPGESNDHADLLAKLIVDVRPDVVICGGDLADMESLCSYDKGTRGAVGRNYEKDCLAAIDFNERLFFPLRKRKRKLPHRVILIGNHEQRIDRALDVDHHLEGTIGYSDLGFDVHYNDVVYYDGGTPGIIEIDGVFYSHYFVSGAMGRPISGVHPAATLIQKNGVTCVSGHLHTLDYSTKGNVDGSRVHGLSGGCFVNYDLEYAGQANIGWWRGVTVLRNVDNGDFDPQFISLDALRKEYGRK